MHTLLIPCPQCKRLVEVIAYRDGKPQEVHIPSHETYNGTDNPNCSFMGFYALPAFDSHFCYFPTSECLTKIISPLERDSDPAAIPEDRPLEERVRNYFFGCPFSTLLKTYIRMDQADNMLYGLFRIFGEPEGDPADDDPFISRLKELHQIIEAALEHRFAEGLRNGRIELSDEHVCFADPRSPETVEIPLSAIRIRQQLITKINPNGSHTDAIRTFVPTPDDID